MGVCDSLFAWRDSEAEMVENESERRRRKKRTGRRWR